MPDQPVRLRVLLQQRHWQNHRTFSAEYDKAAQKIDPRLRGTGPSRAQLHRWLSGDLKGLPYGDHCRILEAMFPGWSAAELFELVPTNELSDSKLNRSGASRQPDESLTNNGVCLVTSGTELSKALLDVVREARECLIAVGSRSSEPGYLHEIEQIVANKPELVHYRILIGPPHSQILKDHLFRLLEIRNSHNQDTTRQNLHVSIQLDITRYYERFFVANEHTAVTALPSANSPMNFDTGIIIRDPLYVRGLLQHGKALYGKHRLETPEAINELEVLE